MVLSIVTAIFTLTSIIFRILQVEKFRRRKQESENDDKRKLVFLHFSFSIILEIALFTLSVLLANITITIYKLRGIIDGTTQSPRNESPELNPMVSSTLDFECKQRVSDRKTSLFIYKCLKSIFIDNESIVSQVRIFSGNFS